MFIKNLAGSAVYEFEKLEEKRWCGSPIDMRFLGLWHASSQQKPQSTYSCQFCSYRDDACDITDDIR